MKTILLTAAAMLLLTACQAPTAAAYDHGWGGQYHTGGYPLTIKP